MFDISNCNVCVSVVRKTVYTRLNTTTYFGKLSVTRCNRIELNHIHALSMVSTKYIQQFACDTDPLRLCSMEKRLLVSFLLQGKFTSFSRSVCRWSTSLISSFTSFTRSISPFFVKFFFFLVFVHWKAENRNFTEIIRFRLDSYDSVH